MSEPADGQRGEGGGDDQRRHPSIEHARDQLDQLDPKIGKQRGQRAQVHGGVEREALIRPAEESRDQNEMSRRRDREEFREALDDAEDERLRVGHEVRWTRRILAS